MVDIHLTASRRLSFMTFADQRGLFIRLPFIGEGYADFTSNGLSAWDWWSELTEEMETGTVSEEASKRLLAWLDPSRD